MPKKVAKKSDEEEEEGGKEKRGRGVVLSSLEFLQPFQYEGQVYTKRRITPSGVHALSQQGDKAVTLPPDTLVTPI
jgi:hypothetical protein